MENYPEFDPEKKPRMIKKLGYLAIDVVKILGCMGQAYIHTRGLAINSNSSALAEQVDFDCDVIRPNPESADLEPNDLVDIRQLSRPSFNIATLLDKIDLRKQEMREEPRSD
jgi:hypothetical protein